MTYIQSRLGNSYGSTDIMAAQDFTFLCVCLMLAIVLVIQGDK